MNSNNFDMNSAVNRRRFFLTGGFAIATTTLLAACGKGPQSPQGEYPRIGVVPPTTGLPDGAPTDEVLLRTATSLEFNAIDTYKKVLALGLFTGSAAGTAAVVNRFKADHEAHAKALSGIITAAKGEPFECANEQINKLYINPALDLILGNKDAGIEPSDTPLDDVMALALGLETLAAETYQFYVSLLSQPKLRAAAMSIGEQESRHAAVLAQAINPGIAGIGPSTNKDTGKPNPAAVPGAFGSLGSIAVSLGKRSAAGNKTTLNMETPSLNSMAYEYAKCS
ncbi:ferritin-like domain-containing protein [bacterium]|nr:ferritin-like domain-containing protein [bacterium]